MFKQKVMRGLIALQLVTALTFSLFSPAIPVASAHHQEGHTVGGGEDKNCPQTAPWVKVDSSSGNKTGAWGEIEWSDDSFSYSLTDGYSIDLCIKSGSKAFDDTSACVIDVENDKVCYFNGLAGEGALLLAQDISHIAYQVHTPDVNPCDPSTYNGSVADKITETEANCVGIKVTQSCGLFSAIIDPNDTPYTYGVSYSVDSLNWNFDTDASNVVFTEDQSGGSVTVYYWAVGPEADFFTALGLPWYQVSYKTVEVNTDCEGSITIEKNAINDSDQVFHFTTTGLSTDNTGFDLVDDATDGFPQQVFNGLPAGTYTVTEAETAGWDFDGVSCNRGATVDKDGTKITITLAEGEDVTCTYTNREEEPEVLVDYCDPSQRPAGQSIAQWLAANQVDASDCFDYTVTNVCGQFNAQFTKNETGYGYEFRYALGNIMPADWKGDGALPVTFDEDENGGSTKLVYYAVGPEKDYFVGYGIPNFWDGNGQTVTVITDCEQDETPETPEEPETPGEVLGEQVERPNVLAAVTQLPSTGVGSEGLSLFFALFLGAVLTRRRI